MNPRKLWSRVLIILGSVGMLVGALDPLEGSLIILPGCGLVTFGHFLGDDGRGLFAYWIWVFIAIAIGVGAMCVLTALGGVGDKSGYSMWWGVLILPYPIGWVMGTVSLAVEVVRRVQHRPAV